ncbi:hypothetical protein CAC42_980 [Sphaceloma murrayae]|uniref:Uncharacterized protein n=1 Tax=Sphaceloma murrayae TaxID=2082308 RepID=A0A2K1R2V9_9PEZI|nr:hypothetical protein CAC42_980 [Sphaceloma murrayae]
MTIDEVSAQLQSELRRSVSEALSSRAPLLHHLNADSSWLLQIPRPQHAQSLGGRFYFNILLDPWLSGGQSDVAKWFSQQFHAIPSAVPSIAAVEDLLRNVEFATSDIRQGKNQRPFEEREEVYKDDASFLDAIAISHEFTDHCHKETLLEIDPNVPVFATEQAARLIDSWKHFRSVQTTPNFGGEVLDWRACSLTPLPDWVSICRIVTPGDALYYHSALLIAFNNGHISETTSDANEDESAEALIYTPHGIHADDLKCLPNADPEIRTLAFLHGLHDINIAKKQQLNLGAHNGLKAQRILRAKYWIGTHDEVKQGGGLVSWFLNRKVINLHDALEEERKQSLLEEGEKVVVGDANKGDVNWTELGNGESKVLV